ncbi:hypothetical protein C5S39_01000 [Candidatus Methanophagaceae archaeon]|nr:hypothetical protein C5S39_01000 [Methanophagales archaeon]
MGTHRYELVVLTGIARAAVEAAVSVVLNQFAVAAFGVCSM